MADTNGQGKSRLDRIEEMIELGEARNQAAHERFEAEFRHLLTAQILMTDNMNKLELKMLETTEKMDALIRVADGVIRRDPPEATL